MWVSISSSWRVCLLPRSHQCARYFPSLDTQFWWGIGLKGEVITNGFVDVSHRSNYLTCMHLFEFCWALCLNKDPMTWLCWVDCNLGAQALWLSLFSSHSTRVQNAAENWVPVFTSCITRAVGWRKKMRTDATFTRHPKCSMLGKFGVKDGGQSVVKSDMQQPFH